MRGPSVTDKTITQLFISHHSSKLQVALELEKTLAKYDVKCWLAPRDVEPSEAFDMAIKRAIDESCGILLLFCSKSDKSPHVKRELILADSSRKAIIPLRLEELDPDELAYHLANSQWIDWLERRESTIERVAAKAHQLSGGTNKTMSVDDLVHRSGAEQTAKDAPEQNTEQLESSEDVAASPRSTNWALIVAVLALGVAIFAAWLIWNNLGSPQEENAPADPVTATEPPAVVPEVEEPATAPVATTTPEPPKIRPSFNCENASFRIEFLICNSPELAELDRALASSYQRAMTKAGARSETLKKEQRGWRKEVRDVCPDSKCVATVMRERIARLREIAVRGLEPIETPDPPENVTDSLVVFEG